jgi:hypothetical protein
MANHEVRREVQAFGDRRDVSGTLDRAISGGRITTISVRAAVQRDDPIILAQPSRYGVPTPAGPTSAVNQEGRRSVTAPVQSMEPSPILSLDEPARSAFGVRGVIRGQIVGLLLSDTNGVGTIS